MMAMRFIYDDDQKKNAKSLIYISITTVRQFIFAFSKNGSIDDATVK